MRNLILVPLFLALLGVGTLAARAQNVALVLSNGYYDNGIDVPDISRRHQQLVTAFQRQGYEVIEGNDLNRLQIRQKLTQFAAQVAGADIAVVALQGHIARFGDSAWLLPADIDANTATGLAFRGVSLDFFAQLLGQAPGRAVLFVGKSDRMIYDIPLVSEGVGRTNLPRGVMMVSGGYRAVEDIVTNSFMRRGARVIDVLRGDIGTLEIEGDIPASLVLAERRVVVNTPEQVEQRLSLNRAERRNVQRDLAELGFDPRGIDGLFGNATRSALRNWQRGERLGITGYLTAEQVALLRRQADEARQNNRANDQQYWQQTGANGTERGLRRYLDRYPDGIYANRARAELARMTALTDEQAWTRAVRLNTPEGYRQYLHDFPRGTYVRVARARIGTPPAVVENDAKRAEDALRLNGITRLLIEQRVADLGYRTGPRDGNFDLATRQGFRQYQRDRNMPVTGYVTADMIRRLLLNQ